MAQLYSPDNIIILGDLNAGNTFLDQRFLNHSPITPYEISLHDELFALNLKQLIHEPTRYTASNGVVNLRDLLIVSNDSMVNTSGGVPCFFTNRSPPNFCNTQNRKFSSLELDQTAMGLSTHGPRQTNKTFDGH